MLTQCVWLWMCVCLSVKCLLFLVTKSQQTPTKRTPPCPSSPLVLVPYTFNSETFYSGVLIGGSSLWQFGPPHRGKLLVWV